MAETGKTPDAGNVEGLKIANHHKGNFALFLAEFQAVKAHAGGPLPINQITQDQGECLRLVVNHAIAGKPAPGVVAWLDLNGKTPKNGAALVVHIGVVIFEVVVAGWRPLIDAFTFMDRAATLQERVEDTKPGKTLLTDMRGQSIKAARALVEDIGTPSNWKNMIPETATISGSWYALSMTRGQE